MMRVWRSLILRCRSRSPDVGTISEKNVVGKAFLRLYPFSDIGSLSQYSEKE